MILRINIFTNYIRIGGISIMYFFTLDDIKIINFIKEEDLKYKKSIKDRFFRYTNNKKKIEERKKEKQEAIKKINDLIEAYNDTMGYLNYFLSDINNPNCYNNIEHDILEKKKLLLHSGYLMQFQWEDRKSVV